MLLRRFVATLAACIVFGLAATGQEKDKPVKIEWKFVKDTAFYQELTTKTQQEMQVMGQPVKQTQTQTFYFSYTPKEQDKDKNWVIEQTIDGVKMDIEISGNKITYDSTAPAQANPLSDFFKALIGAKFKLTVNPKMEVIKIEGRDDFLNRLGNVNQQMKPLLEQMLSNDSLKQMADPAFGMVPNKEVKAGEKWQKKSTLNLGPIGSYENTYDYTYQGKDKNLDKISVTTQLKYTPPGDMAGGSTLPFKIKSANLQSKNSQGTIYFNSADGRLDNSTAQLTLEGDMTIEIGQQSAKVELKQTMTTTVKTTGKNPIEKK